MKKMLMAAALGLAIIFSAPQAEAYEHFVGTSEATGWDCYVLTESIYREDDVTHVTLEMVTQNGNYRWLGYRFWYDSSRDVMRSITVFAEGFLMTSICGSFLALRRICDLTVLSEIPNVCEIML